MKLKIVIYTILLCTILGVSVKATAQNRDSSNVVQKFHISYPEYGKSFSASAKDSVILKDTLNLKDTLIIKDTLLLKDTLIERNTLFAFKSNLLYDLISFANVSVEVPLFKERISLLYYHQFPWWTWGKADNEYCARFLSIGGEARVWFSTKSKLQGHFFGLYGESGKYDFQFQRRICYQGEFYSAGLSYGYAMPIGKLFNLEFSISAGYASIPYRGYTPSNDYEILWRDPEKTGRLRYIGLTKAQISLVLPIRNKKEVVYDKK